MKRPRRPRRIESLWALHFGQSSSRTSWVTSLRETDSFSPIWAEKSFQKRSRTGIHSSLPLEMSSSSSSSFAVNS